MVSQTTSIGQKMTYASTVLLPAHRFDEYLLAVGALLDEDIHYVDPVHELNGKDSVLKMLSKYVPRTANEQFRFEIVHETMDLVLWKWTIAIRIRFTPFNFVIHGFVEAKIRDGRIIYQREYYDPMESICIIPLIGYLYKCVLRMG